MAAETPFWRRVRRVPGLATQTAFFLSFERALNLTVEQACPLRLDRPLSHNRPLLWVPREPDRSFSKNYVRCSLMEIAIKSRR